ncbi:uncharacterized protein LOC118648300 [Monomorium pharaonis]|nr:uncharacterized protein LOC118648300 [Monomorium pharaonis]
MASNKMDEYDKKFAEIQKYLPFLEAMIKRLQNVKDKDNRENQLQKMQSLHEILSNNKQKLKVKTLERCGDVLQNLYKRCNEAEANVCDTDTLDPLSRLLSSLDLADE